MSGISTWYIRCRGFPRNPALWRRRGRSTLRGFPFCHGHGVGCHTISYDSDVGRLHRRVDFAVRAGERAGLDGSLLRSLCGALRAMPIGASSPPQRLPARRRRARRRQAHGTAEVELSPQHVDGHTGELRPTWGELRPAQFSTDVGLTSVQHTVPAKSESFSQSLTAQTLDRRRSTPQAWAESGQLHRGGPLGTCSVGRRTCRRASDKDSHATR